MNLHREIFKSIKVVYFWDVFTTDNSPNTSHIIFKNCKLQPKSKYYIKAKQGSEAMANSSYDIILFSEHGLYLCKVKLEHWWHHHMCIYSYDTFLWLNYNIYDRKNGPWNQVGGTSFSMTKNYRTRKADHGKDSCNLGRWL